MAVPHGGKSVDNPSTRYGAARKDARLRTRHLLLFRRAKLEKGGQGVSPGLQQVGGSAGVECNVNGTSPPPVPFFSMTPTAAAYK